MLIGNDGMIQLGMNQWIRREDVLTFWLDRDGDAHLWIRGLDSEWDINEAEFLDLKRAFGFFQDDIAK